MGIIAMKDPTLDAKAQARRYKNLADKNG